MQLSRLFELVYLLLDRKGMTADELAEHFEVSRRTIYRLSLIHISEPTRPY